jgi:hypothetical protein
VTVEELELHIETLNEERSVRRRTRKPVNGIQEELDATWDQLRRARAAAVYGTSEEIARRARVEREIEKLMGDPA